MRQPPMFLKLRSGQVRTRSAMPRLRLAAAFILCSAAAMAAPPPSDDSVTIYSRLQPGAISPDLYRPVAGRPGGVQVPGYS